jgi:tetratricopeptide (TPR) repeat protein
MPELVRRNAARTLRALRERRGWSWADEARAIKEAARVLAVDAVARTAVASLVRTIARWESESKPVVPGERYQLLLAYAFAARGDDVVVGRGSDFDELMSVFASLGASTDRIAELRRQITRIATGGHNLLGLLAPGLRQSLARALTAPASLSDDVVTQLADLVADVDTQIGEVPFVRLQVALAPAVEACRLLLEWNPAGSARAELPRTAANAFMIAARIAFEVRDFDMAVRLYGQAVNAGRHLALWERAAIRTSQALVVLHATRSVAAARRIVDAAVRDARRGDSRVMRARVYALLAELEARAHDEKRAFAALHFARAGVDGDVTGDPAAGRFGVGYLDGFEGVCNLHLRRDAEAESQLVRALAALDRPRQAVQRAIVTADLALARLRTGTPEAAARLLHECVDLAAATQARVPALRVAEVRRELRPWRTERFVSDLDDHIYDALLAPS